MKKQVSTLSLIALAAFSIWQYFTEHKKDTKPAQQPHNSKVKVQSKIPKILGIMMSSCVMMLLGKTKMPLLITICWPYLGRLHSVKNNARNMAIICQIQHNINVVQKINLAG